MVHQGLLNEVLQRVLLPGDALHLHSVQLHHQVLLLPLVDPFHRKVRTAVKFLEGVPDFVPDDDSDLEIADDSQLVRLLYQVPLPLVLLALSVHVVQLMGRGSLRCPVDRSIPFQLSFSLFGLLAFGL